jgi:hypothetical protein
MNDPHGMFQLKDTVHLFFQYNPRDLAWGEVLPLLDPQQLVASRRCHAAAHIAALGRSCSSRDNAADKAMGLGVDPARQPQSCPQQQHLE